MEGDSDSAAIRPNSATEAAPAPGSLGETNALLRELVAAAPSSDAQGVRLECLRLSQALVAEGLRIGVAIGNTNGDMNIIERAEAYSDFVLGRRSANQTDVQETKAFTSAFSVVAQADPWSSRAGQNQASSDLQREPNAE